MLYRSEDGTCNNLKHSLWGRANVALTRLLAPDYEDGKYYFKFFVASDIFLNPVAILTTSLVRAGVSGSAKV